MIKKRSYFKSRTLAYLLILPQLLITAAFFYWPAVQGIVASFQLSDPFGFRTRFIWFDNYIALFSDPLYLKSIGITLIFSGSVAIVSISCGLFLASMANRALRFTSLTRTLLIWPYAIAPAISGILWLFLLHPSYGVVAIGMEKAVSAAPFLWGCGDRDGEVAGDRLESVTQQFQCHADGGAGECLEKYQL